MTLNDLRNLRYDQLDAMFQAAEPPVLVDLCGDYDGMLLTGNFPPTPRHFSIGLVNQPWLPWKGKAFYPSDDHQGKGANRFELAGLKRKRWPFATSIGASRLDGRDALLVSYDLPGNPFWLKRGTFDELRQIGDELYLGKGGVVALGGQRFIFMWALQPAA